MYAAGLLEGALTSQLIFQHSENVRSVFFPTNASDPQVYQNWFSIQDAWVRSNIQLRSASDPFWRTLGLIMRQFDGMLAGAAITALPQQDISQFQLQLLNAFGDMIDLQNVLSPQLRPHYASMTPEEVFATVSRRGHCSALIKLTPGYEDLLYGHSTWFTYKSLLRVFKHYTLHLADNAVASHSVSFSSYPGYLVSVDDYYALGDSNLIVLETTNQIFDMSLYNRVGVHSVLAWQRVRVANTLAHGGEEWAQLVAKYNSGALMRLCEWRRGERQGWGVDEGASAVPLLSQ